MDTSRGEVRSHGALTLPTHLITRIFSQLDCVDLLRCSQVCKQWYIDSTELREGWKKVCRGVYPVWIEHYKYVY